MLCPPLSPGAAQQVWPGRGIEIFTGHSATAQLSVVSSYSKFLNLERWYVASSGATPSSSRSLTLRHGAHRSDATPHLAAAELEWDFAESYMDRAILTDIDWNRYETRRVPRLEYECSTLKATLRPALVQGRNIYATPDSIHVWLQFWTMADSLTQTAWIFDHEVDWGEGRAGFPSAFEVPTHGADFHEVSEAPASGWIYSGGLRPAPWPG